jgi:hypothetical protein
MAGKLLTDRRARAVFADIDAVAQVLVERFEGEGKDAVLVAIAFRRAAAAILRRQEAAEARVCRRQRARGKEAPRLPATPDPEPLGATLPETAPDYDLCRAAHAVAWAGLEPEGDLAPGGEV